MITLTLPPSRIGHSSNSTRKRRAIHVIAQAVEQSLSIDAHAALQIVDPMEKGDLGDKSKAPLGEIVDPWRFPGFSSMRHPSIRSYPSSSTIPAIGSMDSTGYVVVAVEGDQTSCSAQSIAGPSPLGGNRLIARAPSDCAISAVRSELLSMSTISASGTALWISAMTLPTACSSFLVIIATVIRLQIWLTRPFSQDAARLKGLWPRNHS